MSATTKDQCVPLALPDVTRAEIAEVVNVLRGTDLSMGRRLATFETAFTQYIGARYAIAASSGTAALHLCVIAAGVGEGDFVLTTPFSFVSSANVVLYERGVPIFVDIDERTLNIDPVQVAEAAGDIAGGGRHAKKWLPRIPRVESRGSGLGERLKAILPVHVFGQPCDLDSVTQIASEYGLHVIEDACEAVGAEYKSRKVGRFPEPPRGTQGRFRHAACFAFYPNKQMTTGEGGMVVTDCDDWARLFRSLRNQGRDEFGPWLQHDRLGFNYRLDEMSAALGVVQLGRIDELLEMRQRVADLYSDRLRDVEGISTTYVHPHTTRMSWFVYVVRLAAGIDRDRVMSELLEVGVPTRPYFVPIHLQPFYRERFGYRRGDFPVTERVADSTLALPFFGRMTAEQVNFVCEQLETAISRSAR